MLSSRDGLLGWLAGWLSSCALSGRAPCNISSAETQTYTARCCSADAADALPLGTLDAAEYARDDTAPD